MPKNYHLVEEDGPEMTSTTTRFNTTPSPLPSPSGGFWKSFSKKNSPSVVSVTADASPTTSKKKKKQPRVVTPRQDNNNSDEEEYVDDDKEDPVMAHFRSRTTQKVRFQIEPTTTSDPSQSKANNNKSNTSSLRSTTNSNKSAGVAIHRFVTNALFGNNSTTATTTSSTYEEEAKREIDSSRQTWRSTTTARRRRHNSTNTHPPETTSSTIIPQVTKLLNKARRALHVHHKYNYAVQCHVKALDLLTSFPDDHPLVVQTLQGLSVAHHKHSSYTNSANIVQMGIKSEEQGEWIRALKMYTIAYRIRRDQLSTKHPSLVILLNMLGSIQVKRGEWEEAMQIYELALRGVEPEKGEELPPPVHLMTRSVTYREMGTIYEHWRDYDKALEYFHYSLQCIADFKGLDYESPLQQEGNNNRRSPVTTDEDNYQKAILNDLELVRLARSYVNKTAVVQADLDATSTEEEGGGGMELMLGYQKRNSKNSNKTQLPIRSATSNYYDIFFPPSLEDTINKKGFQPPDDDTTKKHSSSNNMNISNRDAALTLHQIAQLHRNRGEYNLALAAFDVALRGMKYSLGKYHPSVAAILGNIGNLLKEMGDMDAAFETYQQVLAIESYRLGLSHPDVTVTLHNIATIDAARGNPEHALSLYQQVLSLQTKLFGRDDQSLAVTSACMGEVQERLGNLEKATDCFEESLRIKMMATGRHSLEVARLFHKLGKLAIQRTDFQLAEICVSKAVMVYRLNHLEEDSEWIVDAKRDRADIDAAIAMGRGIKFEC